MNHIKWLLLAFAISMGLNIAFAMAGVAYLLDGTPATIAATGIASFLGGSGFSLTVIKFLSD